MTFTKTTALAAMALVAAASPLTVKQNPATGMYRVATTCAAVQEAVIGDSAVPNAGCEPAWDYVCTTPTRDYEDKRPI